MLGVCVQDGCSDVLKRTLRVNAGEHYRVFDGSCEQNEIHVVLSEVCDSDDKPVGCLSHRPWALIVQGKHEGWEDRPWLRCFKKSFRFSDLLDFFVVCQRFLYGDDWSFDPISRGLRAREGGLSMTEQEAQMFQALMSTPSSVTWETLRHAVWACDIHAYHETLWAAWVSLKGKVKAMGVNLPKPSGDCPHV